MALERPFRSLPFVFSEAYHCDSQGMALPPDVRKASGLPGRAFEKFWARPSFPGPARVLMTVDGCAKRFRTSDGEAAPLSSDL
jgi:hypothetical protein